MKNHWVQTIRVKELLRSWTEYVVYKTLTRDIPANELLETLGEDDLNGLVDMIDEHFGGKVGK